LDALTTHAPILAIAVPLAAAFLTPLVGRLGAKVRNVFVVAILLFVEFLVFTVVRQVLTAGIQVYTLGATAAGLAIPESHIVPVRIILEVDGLGAFLGIIAATVALSGAVYSLSAMRGESGQDRFYTLLLLLTASMLGIQYTGDLFNLFVFLEILSISGAALAAFRTRFVDAVEGGFKYVIVSTVSALLVLLSIGIFYGQYNLLNIAAVSDAMRYTLLDKIALALLIGALLTKSGAVPSHWWVPDTYTPAPAGTSPIIYASSLTCLGAALRIVFSLYGVKMTVSAVGWLVIVAGLLSMFIGVTMALRQTDIKRLMTYHVISQEGYMLLGFGVGLAVLGDPQAVAAYGREAIAGGLFHVLNNAFFKGLLLLTGEALFFALGTRDLDRMGGMGRTMKWTCAFFIIGALAISGIPPMNGFASKLMIYETSYQLNPMLAIVALIVSIMTLASFTKVFQAAFTGPGLPEYRDVKPVPLSMKVGMGVLAAGTLFFSLFPQLVLDTIVYPATDALLNQTMYIGVIMGGS